MKLQTFRPTTLLKRDSKTGAFLLQNFWETYIEEYLRIGASELNLQSDCPKLLFLDSRFQNHPQSVILQKYQSLLNQSFF